MNSLGMIAIVIDDYDAAIKHYVEDLGFTLLEDTTLTAEKRWVVVAPSDQGARILLAKAANESQKAAIGNSTGGRVGFFLYTTNFSETYELYKSRGIEFIEPPPPRGIRPGSRIHRQIRKQMGLNRAELKCCRKLSE